MQRSGTEPVGRPAVRSNLGACVTVGCLSLAVGTRGHSPAGGGPGGEEMPAPAVRGHSGTVLYRATARLPWDDLDARACAEDGTPDWNSLIVVGPIKRRGEHGQVTLEWKVTVYCRPAVTPRPRSANRPGECDTRDEAATPTLRMDS